MNCGPVRWRRPDRSKMPTKNSATRSPAHPQDQNAKANAELKEEYQRLLGLAEYRASQISHLAHELRTPLTSILGFTEILLSQEELTDPQRNFCERIQNSAYQLQRTLNQLSDLGRLQSVPPAHDSEVEALPKK
jgi:signal transduction histidine kinase